MSGRWAKAALFAGLWAAVFAAGAGAGGGDAPRVRLRVVRVGCDSALLEIDEQVAREVKREAAWEITSALGPGQRVEFRRVSARSGSRCLLLYSEVRDPNKRCEVTQRLQGVLAPGKAYTCFVYFRGRTGATGAARVMVDCHSAGRRGWETLATVEMMPNAFWRPQGGQFILPDDALVVRVRIILFGEGELWVDDVALYEAQKPEENLLRDPGFEGTGYWKVFYRAAGDEMWVEDPAIIHEPRHNVILLRQETEYEFRAQVYSNEGALVGRSGVVRARTRALAPRRWEGLEIWPSRRLGLGRVAFPCLFFYRGEPYVVCTRDYAVELCKLDGALRATQWRKILVAPPPIDGGGVTYQGQVQACLLGNVLYVSFKRDRPPYVREARLCVAAYDMERQALLGVREIAPLRRGASSWNGGIAAVRGKLWVGYADTFAWSDRVENYIVLREVDPATLEPSPREFRLRQAPSTYLYGPYLASYSGKVAVLFSDMALHAGYTTPPRRDYEPLYLALFDGREFSEPLPISCEGRNRDAKAVQVGEKLYVVWKYGGPYPAAVWGEYMFHDIGLAVVDPVRREVKLCSCVSDLKYNSSPCIVRYDGELIVVYTKHEHLYGLQDDPAQAFGPFWVAIGLPRGAGS